MAFADAQAGTIIYNAESGAPIKLAGTVSKGEPVSKKLTLLQTDGEDLKVEKVECGENHRHLTDGKISLSSKKHR